MSYEELSKSVKLSEGFRNKIYQDTEGFDTIGWGHKVVVGDNFVPDKEYTEEELQSVFDKDLSRAIAQAKQLMTQNNIDDLPETAQHVLAEMCFQLGQYGVQNFRNMWKCLQEANFIGASYERSYEIMRLENFFTEYKKQLIARQKQVEESITSGLCKDWSDYKYLTGKNAALKQEIQELSDLLKKTELEDD